MLCRPRRRHVCYADLGDDTCCGMPGLHHQAHRIGLLAPPGIQHWFTCTARHTGLVYISARHTALVYLHHQAHRIGLLAPGTQHWFTSPPGTQHCFTCTTRHTALLYLFAAARSTSLEYTQGSPGSIPHQAHSLEYTVVYQAHRLLLACKSPLSLWSQFTDVVRVLGSMLSS